MKNLLTDPDSLLVMLVFTRLIASTTVSIREWTPRVRGPTLADFAFIGRGTTDFWRTW